MEAGRPGWYDALNGLPGLFGSSLSEAYELERLLTFLLEAMAEKGEHRVDLPVEQWALLQEVEQALATRQDSVDPDRDYRYWDTVATARETYRECVCPAKASQTHSGLVSPLLVKTAAPSSGISPSWKRSISSLISPPPRHGI